MKEALDLVAGRIAERGVQVEVTEEPILLCGDRPRLVEVFQNLVDNAVKFMGDQPAPRVEIGVEPDGGETVFFVRDNGIGIDPRHQPKLFGLFEKLDPGSEGTGIGLALVKRIVEVHGGRIWVESEGPGRARPSASPWRRPDGSRGKEDSHDQRTSPSSSCWSKTTRRTPRSCGATSRTSAWRTGSSTSRTDRRRWTTSSARPPTPTPSPAPGRT